MAKITPGAIISEISGSIAAETYSRSKYGMYVKSKLTQTNPDTPAQQAARAIQAAAVAAWQSLTSAEQIEWNKFAISQLSKPRLSLRSTLNGYNAFIRFYITRNTYGLTGNPDRVNEQPLGTYSGFAFDVSASAIDLTLIGDNTNPDIFAVARLSGPRSAGQSTITQSMVVNMDFQQAPNGSLTFNLLSAWEAKWDSLSSFLNQKIFAQIDIVNRVTAQKVTVFRSASVIPMPSGYDLVLAYGTLQGYTLPSLPQQAIQSQLYDDLVASGIWDELDVFYCFATDGDRDFAKINWKNPGTHDCTEVNTPTFTPDTGFFGNGSSSYLNTNFAPDPDGTKYSQNDAAFFLWSITDTPAAALFHGANLAAAASALHILPKGVSNQGQYRMNGAQLGTNAIASSIGLYHAKRIDAANIEMFVNGVLFDQQAGASEVLCTQPAFLEALNNNGTAATFSTRGVAFAGFGASLNGMESDLYDAINDYLTTI